MVLLEYNGRSPNISGNSYVSPLATLIGDVTVNDNAIIWPGSIIRAENSKINIGDSVKVRANEKEWNCKTSDGFVGPYTFCTSGASEGYLGEFI